MEKFINLKDTAAIVRKELKEKLPLTKFSVKIKKNKSQDPFKPNNEIYISWTDGYTVEQVKEICDRFRTHYLPGGSIKTDTWDEQEVRWGCDVIKYQRSIDWENEDGLGLSVSDAFDEFGAWELFTCNVEKAKYWYERYRKQESVESRLQLHEIKKGYLQQIIAQISEHDDWQNIEHSLVLEDDTVRARLNSAGSEFDRYQQLKIIYFKLCPNCDPISQAYRTKWLVNGALLSEDAYTVLPEKPPQLEIEGIIVKGKIKDYIESNNLQQDNLENILDSFYRSSKGDTYESEAGAKRPAG